MCGRNIPIYSMNTIVVGTGVASLSTADHLHNMGQTDIAMITEKVGGGISNNAGSDKQTYYKLSVFGKESDSPYEMAKSLYDGGCMHGDIALIEALCSTQSFFRLVNIGVPFPHNRLGGFVGYKTDHDPRQRATSCGPWTSKQMVQCLLKEVQDRGIKIFDEYEVIHLLAQGGRACGVVALDKKKLHTQGSGLTLFQAENVVFGVGGPGGIYKSSVYPKAHTGAIGLALEVGAKAVNLTESQYGLSSTKFRWNVSGSYQQVIPRYISTDQMGGDTREFLNAYFETMGQLATTVFLKGYQWPFDPRKIQNHGSSLIDLLVSIETVVKGRRVYLDFCNNPDGGNGLGKFRLEELSKEAYAYLSKSNALYSTPIERLWKMNRKALEVYRNNGIDITKEPLEVAVCAQHNNGGLLGDLWWESNIKHLFPVGEVNGSHGVYRPGGSALNSGQVGSLRTAQRIVHSYQKSTFTNNQYESVAREKIQEVYQRLEYLKKNKTKKSEVMVYRDEFQTRMTAYGSHIRELDKVEKALEEAYTQIGRHGTMKIRSEIEIPDAFKNRHLVLAHAAYLEAIRFYLKNDGGSRGSYIVVSKDGIPVLPDKLKGWIFKLENSSLREKMIETIWKDGRFDSEFTTRRPIPQEEYWFENVWNEFLKGEVFM